MRSYSAIIITRNREEKLKKALKSLNILPEVSEITIIDNNSGNELHIPSSVKKITVITNSSTLGVSENRNKGIKLASSNGIIFLDDDAFIEKINLSEISMYLEAHEDVGIIAPRLFYPNGKLQESARSYPTIPALLWRGLKLYKLYEPSWYKKYVYPLPETTIHPTEVSWAIGACLIVRKEVFDAIGLFDEYYTSVYDDVDFCRRTQHAGFKVVYWPDSKVIHEYTRTSAKIFTKATIRHIKSIVRFLLSKN